MSVRDVLSHFLFGCRVQPNFCTAFAIMQMHSLNSNHMPCLENAFTRLVRLSRLFSLEDGSRPCYAVIDVPMLRRRNASTGQPVAVLHGSVSVLISFALWLSLA